MLCHPSLRAPTLTRLAHADGYSAPHMDPLFFYFSCAGAHPDLHSFPTRRSSDPRQRRPLGGARRAPTSPRRDRDVARSEEHTSELQSLRHLVCRLLLEKKKTKGIETSPSPVSRSAQ